MIYRWLICSSLLGSLGLTGASVGGRVVLKDSRDPAVRKGADYSGVVVSLRPISGVPALSTSGKHARMIQKDKTFVPHVLPILVGGNVDFPNYDPIFHNAFSSYNGQLFDVGLYAPGTSRTVHFTREGVVRVFCNIHSSMSAVIVVLGTPYFATSSRRGAYQIEDVPPGEYDLSVFHERATQETLKSLSRRVSVGSAPVTLPEIVISEIGYLPTPHKNKYGRDYSNPPDERSIYPAVRQ